MTRLEELKELIDSRPGWDAVLVCQRPEPDVYEPSALNDAWLLAGAGASSLLTITAPDGRTFKATWAHGEDEARDRELAALIRKIHEWRPFPPHNGQDKSDRPLFGHILSIENDSRGVQRAVIACPQCNVEMTISEGDAAKCACGLQWSLQVSAVGREVDEGEQQ